MSFQQGLSGLAAASKQLDVIGNNVANASTVGFKRSRAEFADLYSASLYGVGSSQTGIGARTVQVSQQFNQGPVTPTANPLDLAVSGNGFFRVDNAGTVMYTRNGEFQLDRDGYFNNQGHKLTGYGVDASGNVIPGPPQPLRVNTASIGAKATSSIKMTSNLDARATAPTVAFPGAIPTAPDAKSYNYTNSTTVYDSLGVDHLMTYYYVKKAAPANTWDVYTAIDGQPNPNPPAAWTPFTTLTFDTAGKVTAPTAAVNFTQTLTNGASNLSISVDVTNFTQFAGAYSNDELVVDGFSNGVLTGINTTREGIVEAQYSNGQRKTIGQVVLISFTNAQGLQPIGDNRWLETYTAGKPKINTPGSGNVGTIQSAAVESSNVDLTTELVDMITAQRFYQANAQTIKTQDAVLQTLINIR